jgi:hypothetical protein
MINLKKIIWPKRQLTIIKNAASSAKAELTLNSIALFLKYRLESYSNVSHSSLKLKKVIRAMSKGPVAKKKKSSVQISLGRRAYKSYNNSNILTGGSALSFKLGAVSRQKGSTPITILIV